MQKTFAVQQATMYVLCSFEHSQMAAEFTYYKLNVAVNHMVVISRRPVHEHTYAVMEMWKVQSTSYRVWKSIATDEMLAMLLFIIYIIKLIEF